jgi:hypothetical protein
VSASIDRSAIEAYVGRVRAVVIARSDYLSADDLGFAGHPIDHGAPAEALVQIAWAIVESGVRVPDWRIQAIYDLGDGINDPYPCRRNLREFSIGA